MILDSDYLLIFLCNLEEGGNYMAMAMAIEPTTLSPSFQSGAFGHLTMATW